MLIFVKMRNPAAAVWRLECGWEATRSPAWARTGPVLGGDGSPTIIGRRGEERRGENLTLSQSSQSVWAHNTTLLLLLANKKISVKIGEIWIDGKKVWYIKISDKTWSWKTLNLIKYWKNPKKKNMRNTLVKIFCYFRFIMQLSFLLLIILWLWMAFQR